MKQLPLDAWPQQDREAFERIFTGGDIFGAERGAGAHLRHDTREAIRQGYRRWLGFLRARSLLDPASEPAGRITRRLVLAYADELEAQVRAMTVFNYLRNLHYAARLIAPARDWSWFHPLERGFAKRVRPIDRYDRLVPAWELLDHGIDLMGEAVDRPPLPYKRSEVQYRDGLVLALLSVWPIRARSLASMTAGRHIEVIDDDINLLLYPDDTKSRRFECFRLPQLLNPFLKRYLADIRPALLGNVPHDGLWPAREGMPLTRMGFYRMVRGRAFAKFGKRMCLHDIRRSASTFLAMETPDKAWIAQAALQHTSPAISDTRYNLARSIGASRRYCALIQDLRRELAADQQPVSTKPKTPQKRGANESEGEGAALAGTTLHLEAAFRTSRLADALGDGAPIDLQCLNCGYACRIAPAQIDLPPETPLAEIGASFRCPDCLGRSIRTEALALSWGGNR